jgi:hypothetical protein
MGQGSGDLMPQNVGEIWFAIGLMVLNLSLYSYVLGSISNMFTAADVIIVERRKKFRAVERYIERNVVSDETELKIRNTAANADDGAYGISVEEERAVFQKLSVSLKLQVSKVTCLRLPGSEEYCGF